MPARLRLAALVVLLLVPAGRVRAEAPAPDPAATPADTSGLAVLLEAHAAALGGREAIARLERVALEGEAEAAGLHGRFRLVAEAPARHRLDLQCGPLSESSGFDGERAWVHDRNAVTRFLHLSERDEAILRGLLFTRAYLSAGGLDLGPDRERPGSDLVPVLRRLPSTEAEDLVALALGRGPEVTLFLDRRTHLLVASTWIDGGVEVRSDYGDYRAVGGVLVAHRVDRTSPGDMDEHYLVIRAVANPGPEELGEGAFAMLATRRNVTLAGGAGRGEPGGGSGGETIVPVRVLGQHLLAEAKIDGRPAGLFFLDTGAGANCVNERVADSLGLAPAGEVVATGVGGITTTRFRRVSSLELGGCRLGEHIAVGLDLKPIEEAVGMEIGGIIGYDLWSQVVFRFDYEKGTLELRDPEGVEAGSRGREVELLLADNVPLLRGTVEDRYEGWFRLDSGSGSRVDLHAPFVRRHDLLAGRETARAQALGVGGGQAHVVGTLAAFTLGGERFTDLEAGFSQATSGAFIDEDTAGNIGGGLLRQLAITFDYGRERAWVERLAGAAEAERGFGFSAGLDGGRLVVIEVKPGRPAAAAGLRAGDVVLEVRGDAFDRSRLLEAPAIFRFAEGESEVEMVVEREGERVRLTVRP